GTGAGGLAIVGTAANNSGLIKAQGGRLLLQSSTIHNNGGTVSALGGHVDLSNTSILGGAVSTDATGIINTIGGSNTIDNANVTNAGTLNIGNNTSLNLGSNVTNTGNINLNSAGNNTDLIIDVYGAKLMGAGHITLSDNGTNRVYGSSAGN